MKITLIKEDEKKQLRLQVRELNFFLERMRSTNGKDTILDYRKEYPTLSRPDKFIRYNQMTRVVPAVELVRQENGALGMKEFNNIVTLEVRDLPSQDEAERVKRMAMDSANTLVAFVGASGLSVVVLVSVAPMKGETPTNETEAEIFYQRAYNRLLPIYDGILGTRVTRMEAQLRHSFLMTFDPNPLLNADATPFRIWNTPVATPSYDEDEHLLALPELKRTTEEEDWEKYDINENIYFQATQEAQNKASGKRHSLEWVQTYLTALATEMCRRGMPEEEAVMHTWRHIRYRNYNGLTEDVVRSIYGAVYAEMRPRSKSAQNESSQLMRQLIRRMETRYQFRMNTIMGYTEYRPNRSWPTPWLPVTEKVINTFTTDLQLAELDVWDRDVRRYINSTRIPEYNAVEEFLWRVHDKWDGRDHIRQLAATVPTDTPREWAEWFHTWFLAMVAQWQGYERRFGNSIVPLLVSQQGQGKSAFCRQLLPPELRRWGYTDNLSLAEERQVHLAMAQMLLINLDEFNAISQKKQEGFLKNIVQLPSVKVKRPYGKHIEDVPRLASFIATTNMANVLTDPSGSRRFVGIQVTGDIDLSQTPNYEQLYAQALAELEQHTRYWFNDSDNALVMQHNLRFQQQTSEGAFFHEYFMPSPDGVSGEWMSSASIITYIKERARASFRPPTPNRMGRILNNVPGIQHRHTMHGELYLVVKR